MKQFGLYNIKDYEQLECIGTIKEISEYLNESQSSLRSYLSRKKKGKSKFVRQKYDLVEIKENK